MLIRKETSVTKMQSKKANHDAKSDGIQTAGPIGATSLMNANERPSAPLANVRRYLSKFSVLDLVSSHTFFRYSSCNSSALVFSAMSNPVAPGLNPRPILSREIFKYRVSYDQSEPCILTGDRSRTQCRRHRLVRAKMQDLTERDERI